MLAISSSIAQKQEQKKDQSFQINGKITGGYSGKVYLVKEDRLKGQQTVLDSCEVIDGNYAFKGQAPQYSVIHFIRGKSGELSPFFLEPGNISISAPAHHFLGAETSGTVNNNLWSLYNLQSKFVRDSIMKTTVTDWMRLGRGTEEFESAEFNRRTKLTGSRHLTIQHDMAQRYNNESFAPFIILFEMVADVSLDELKKLRASLAPNLAGHPYVNQLDEYIENMAFKIGMKAPAFNIMGIDGKEIELKNYAGKYVLLDFWASWCGPCLREMPTVKKLYEETRGKNFEIIGISVDSNGEAWRKSVKDQDLKWPQAADLLAWNSPVARKYNVHAIPRTILINPQGDVVAIDLRGEELSRKVKSLLEKK